MNDVSLEAAPASVTAIIGGNGAGKSTVLNMISGVEPPTSGKVIFDGRELSAGTPSSGPGWASAGPSRRPASHPT